MSSLCRVNPLLYRLNLFCLYVLALISCLLLLTQVGLVSHYGHTKRSEKGKSFVRVVMESTDLPREMAMMGLEEEYRNFEAEYRDMVVAEDENATDFVYADAVTVDLSDFMFDATEVTPTDVGNDGLLTYGQTFPEQMKDNTELLYRIEGLKRLHSRQELSHRTILLWNDNQYPEFPIPQVPLCGGGCRLSKNRDDINQSDAIVFTMKELNLSDLPHKEWRKPQQVYVWWSEESAWTSRHMYDTKIDEIEENYFNWTMTFKTTSDINAMMIPYSARDYVTARLKEYESLHPSTSGRVERLPDEDVIPPPKRTDKEISNLMRQAVKLVQRKKKMVAWVASNCGYTSGASLRMNILMKLSSLGLPIDVYGECGDTAVPVSLTGFADMLSEYKYYLAFENAVHCKDYVTEKFWYNSLHAGTVPIVWGPRKSDLEAVAPPNSFIFYEDFEDAEKLVEYLLYLNEHNEEYMKYFAWWWEVPGYFPVYAVTETDNDVQSRTSLYDFEINAFCHLCSRLNNEDHLKHPKSIHSLHDLWYDGETDELCLAKSHGIEWKENNRLKIIPKDEKFE